MIHSCFDPPSGLYDYFEDNTELPINADHPIPRLSPDVNGLGVPAIDAGRPMPPSSRHVGRGWHARGRIIACGKGAISGDAAPSSSLWEWVKNGGWKFVVGGVAVIWLIRRI